MRVFGLVLLLASFAALAAETHTITVTLPTQYVDNSALDPALIKATRIQCGLGAKSPSPAWVIDDTIATPALSRAYTFPTNGTWNCHAWVVLTNGQQSDDTPDLVFAIPLAITPPPVVNPPPPVTTVPKAPAIAIQ